MLIKFNKPQSVVHKDRSKSIKTLISCRGFGKSFLALRSAVISCLTYSGPISVSSRPIVLVIMDTLKDCRQTHWDYLLAFVEGELKDIVASVNKSELKIRFKGLYPDLQLVGLGDTGDGNNLRGMSYADCVIDEASNISKLEYLLDSVLIPRLVDGCQILVIGTSSSGANSPFHKLSMRKDVALHTFNVYESPLYTLERIEYLKGILSPRAFEAEFMNVFQCASNNVFDNFTDDNIGVYNGPYAKEVYYLGTDNGSTNAAYAVVKVLILEDNTLHIEVVETYQSDSTITVEEVVDKYNQLNKKYNFYRINIYDDRNDIVVSCRRKGLKQAISIPRNKDGYRPLHRAETLNTLFYNNAITIHPELVQFIDQIRGYRRSVDSQGNVIFDKFIKENDHLIDACNSVIAYIYTNK